MKAYEKKAHAFLRETQFHLGDMVTEQPHPKTMALSSVIAKDAARGIDMLLSVDEDILSRAGEVFASPGYAALKKAIRRIMERGGRVFFSGCGSTGRLAIMLETLWRRFWTDAARRFPAQSELFKGRAEGSCSIMTGGDRALIRSVENFEDYAQLGRRQSSDNGVSPDDLFIAVSEGGETSSVIGTALGAADLGAEVFFLYNNPDEVLKAKVERSRRIIEDPRVTTVNLTTGPMALAGSTRMQATTMELFILGTALEDVCAEETAERTGHEPAFTGNREEKYTALFASLLEQLRSEDNLKSLAEIVLLEEETYRAGGLITYTADTYLLDIFSDTTERSPTFMLPPFKKTGDSEAVQSWAFARDPLRNARDAWIHMLRREPRGLDWTAGDYRSMNTPPALAENPPVLDRDEIYSYAIGSEEDREREERGALILFELPDGRSDESEKLRAWYEDSRSNYARGSRIVTVGPGAGNSPNGISLDLPSSEMYIFWHLFFKIILNALSTGTMGRMGRIWGNWMVQVDATNKKLIDRSCRIISSLSGGSYDDACLQLFRLMEEKEQENRRDNRSFVIMALEERGESWNRE